MSQVRSIYLVVRADGEIRVAKRPRIASDEVAIALTLRFPDGWGTVIQHLAIEMPEPPTVEEEGGTP